MMMMRSCGQHGFSTGGVVMMVVRLESNFIKG